MVHPTGGCSDSTKLPWIPAEAQWTSILDVAKNEPIRNRVMLALAYDAALRREELCSLRTEDLDPAQRTLRIRAETTKNRRERVVPHSAPTGVFLSGYFAYRATISRARGPLFLSESGRNYAQPVELVDVVESGAPDRFGRRRTSRSRCTEAPTNEATRMALRRTAA